MSGLRDVHRRGTALMSTALVLLGIAMIVSTIANGGGPFAIGVLLGLLFGAVGAGRLYLGSRG